MTQAINGTLVLVDCHTTAPKIFWKGEEVTGIKSITVENDGEGTATVEIASPT